MRGKTPLKPVITTLLGAAMITLIVASSTWAQEWPTYRHDNRRSGVTDAKLSFPLNESWIWKSPHVPQTAWTGPAKWDAWAGNRGLQSMRNFDPCFYVTVDDERVYFGSSVDDAAHALKLSDGSEAWIHFTGAAVRMPPTIADGNVVFGSDDGKVYCCDATNGELRWSRRASKERRSITSNRKIISLWPVRTGVMVKDRQATFAGSLVPWETSFLCTVDLATGESEHEGCFVRELKNVTLQGALLASERLLYAPQGRSAPLAIERSTGKLQGTVGSAGGVFCILSPEEQLIAGPPNQKSGENEVRIAALESKKALVSFSGTDRILLDQEFAYLVASGKLRKLNRQQYIDGQTEIADATALIKSDPSQGKSARARIAAAETQVEQAWGWASEAEIPIDMIKAGDAIILGFDREVRAVDANSGDSIWSADVEGRACGLAVAAGRLFVSTDLGFIYAFESVRSAD
ncbi:MAG: PQQ-binding-like beta-propeller repeat protein [Planctomycetota bacterium]